MTERVKRFLDFHLQRDYRKNRITVDYSKEDTAKTVNGALAAFLNNSTPLIFPDDIYGFNRSVENLAPLGMSMTNFTPDYAWALENGFDKMKDELLQKRLVCETSRREFYDVAITTIELMFVFCEQYKNAAKQQGANALYQALCTVPHKAPKNYHEALVLMKIILFFLRATNATHVTLGRFDQYLYPFFVLSRENGQSLDELLELTELFFISINMDTDLYPGVQQGDNGQSLLLGGRTLTREDGYNELSETVMQASEELCLIDPKINLRVHKNTPLERYVRATRLTKKGLGFPQYCNDDIVIEGLQKLGYEYEDAVEYTVAACWEFITPTGHDIPNVCTMNFPLVIRNATVQALPNCQTFEDFMKEAEKAIISETEAIIKRANEYAAGWYTHKNPFGSIFVEKCRETGITINELGAKYNNYGIHGLGIAPAADALAAIKKCVFEDKTVSPQRLIAALENNFQGEETLRKTLIDCPKMGNNDDFVDSIAERILTCFSNRLNNAPNAAGGVFRAGTGGPHNYIYGSQNVGATAEGRLAGQPYPSSFSPSIGVKTAGPISVVKSFTKFDMTNTINGGPLTLEIHDNVFRNEEGVKKVAMLVKCFINLGGHQLQINSICREKLLDAQAHPEKYPDLIVRVWGWSGYFNELDVCFQNQIISRTEYTF